MSAERRTLDEGTRPTGAVSVVPHPYIIRTLLRHAGRWGLAAEQDEEPLVRALHANYAMGYILALREIASDAEVLALTGVDPYVVFIEILTIQDAATAGVVMACPDLMPASPMAQLVRGV